MLSSGCSDSPVIDKASFLARLHQLAGPGAKDCGAGDETLNRSVSIQCAADALDRRQPFFVGFGRDTEFWRGFAMNSDGQAWSLRFDPDVSAWWERKRARLVVHHCEGPHAAENMRLLTCEDRW